MGVPSVMLSQAASTSGPMPVKGDLRPKLPLKRWTSYSMPWSASGTAKVSSRLVLTVCDGMLDGEKTHAIAREACRTPPVAGEVRAYEGP